MYIHPYIYTFTHTYIHTYTHTHIYTPKNTYIYKNTKLHTNIILTANYIYDRLPY